MFQVEVIDRVAEAEQCVVRNVETFGLICCLTVVVVEVDRDERSYLGWQQFSAA